MSEKEFIDTIREYYKTSRRDMPWRDNITPYRIVISEIMLQQTQAQRVVKKFNEFIKIFPNFTSLSKAPLIKVLSTWKGLGYNSRALRLQKLAQIVMKEYKGVLPSTYDELLELPSIGPNTAGSILAFAYNIPHTFIETNIRAVYIHFFFQKHRGKVPDTKLLPLIEKTLDIENPREWYYALMDYGAHLKQTLPNPSRKSKHHVKQSTFKGSNRELRSQILQAVMKQKQTSLTLEKLFPNKTREQINKNITDLTREGFIQKNRVYLSIRDEKNR